MKLSVAFFDAVNGVGRGIGNAFNFASGSMMLKSRGLTRTRNGESGSFGLGMTLATTVGLLGLGAGLPGWLALLCVLEAAFLPAQLNALYTAGRHDKKNAAKPVAKKELQQV